MKPSLKKLLLQPVLMTGLSLILAGQATAQTFRTLYSFTASSLPTYTNGDGALPGAGMNLSGNTLYGTTQFGGNYDFGTVFALNIDDLSFASVWGFITSSVIAGSEGGEPVAAPTLSGTTLYGTVPFYGGANGGAVFSVQTNGGPYTALHNFASLSGTGGTYGTNSDGSDPYAGLILSGNTLYGTAFLGGSSGWGTVYAVDTGGTGFTNLHSFTGGSNGANPHGGLVLSGNALYGTTSSGFIPAEQSGYGTVFAINTNGTGFTTLYSFTNGDDGSQPFGSLILAGDVLYGTAYAGGSAGWGTVFALNTNGSNFTILHSFTNGSDGSMPWASLVLSGHTLYGTANRGGSAGDGAVFSVSTDGSRFTTLHSFSGSVWNGISAYTNSDGDTPLCGLILLGNTLYGTAELGGINGNGTIFSITLPAPQLTLAAAGTDLNLTWPTNYAGFDDSGYILQSTTNLGSPTIWSTVSPAPVVVNGQFTVTNLISGTEQFFRLSQP